jgi:ubiquinone/menaquinone biosynthesis C-methylase UbiE
MADDKQNYLLAGGSAELERLTLQARVLQPEAEIMLDKIGIRAGASCIDLGCGALGIIEPLSRRAGSNGRVVGVDLDDRQLAAARHMVSKNGLENVEILERDAYHTGLPDQSFDLVHVRFVFAPVGRDDELLRELLRLAKPGGVIAIQEPDSSSWNCFPAHPSWRTLIDAIVKTFARGGGDFNAGQRTYQMLRKAGLQDVHVRAVIVALQDRHPYMRAPIQFATSLRQRILDGNILSEADLDRIVADCERIANDPETMVLSYAVTQVWGRKPAQA